MRWFTGPLLIVISILGEGAAKTKAPAYFPLEAIIALPVPDRKPFESFFLRNNLDINMTLEDLQKLRAQQPEVSQSSVRTQSSPLRKKRVFSAYPNRRSHSVPILGSKLERTELYAAGAIKQMRAVGKILNDTERELEILLKKS